MFDIWHVEAPDILCPEILPTKAQLTRLWKNHIYFELYKHKNHLSSQITPALFFVHQMSIFVHALFLHYV